MTYIVSSGALNSTHSLTHSAQCNVKKQPPQLLNIHEEVGLVTPDSSEQPPHLLNIHEDSRYANP